jgi:hypothetical protein
MVENTDIDANTHCNNQTDDPNLSLTPQTIWSHQGLNENAPMQASESSPNAQHSGGTVEDPPPLIKNRNLEHQSPQMVQRPKLNEAMVGRFDEGYDSDGQIGPFYDTIVAEGKQISNEDSLCEVVNATDTATTSSASSNTAPPTAQLVQLPIDVFIHIEQEALNKCLRKT